MRKAVAVRAYQTNTIVNIRILRKIGIQVDFRMERDTVERNLGLREIYRGPLSGSVLAKPK